MFEVYITIVNAVNYGVARGYGKSKNSLGAAYRQAREASQNDYYKRYGHDVTESFRENITSYQMGKVLYKRCRSTYNARVIDGHVKEVGSIA